MKSTEIGEAVAKSLISTIPVLGSAVTSIWSDVRASQAKRKEERLEVFYGNLREDLLKIGNRLNNEYINKADFLDIFESTANYIINERTQDKRTLFENIFINSMTAKDCDFDKTEKYLRMVDQMDNLELLILRVLDNPLEYNTKNGEIVKDPNWIQPGVRNTSHSWGTYYFLDILTQLLDISQDDIFEAVYFLEQNRLILDKASKSSLGTNSHPICVLEDKLTSKGKDFILFLLGKNLL